ncbi:Growth hormone-inducible transmembrane protein, putative [Pediculus humanus corporis]|uniref:Growth hormone-inducible transmembrane protein, putative n=1 Tax=Pediculus humanus subsp. corporis TaxID=121224 RepID=E0VK20_PEDHC|nr:Growth hormone-inducible transmembrane protein, putative [Pediculus humanus corporis]EEB13726.1 Growth hormone-inducible transmembrane protein, putative [Pediculus humanus corporis]
MSKEEEIHFSNADIVFSIGSIALLFVSLIELFILFCYIFICPNEDNVLRNINSQRWSLEAKSNIEITYTYLFASIYICIVSAIFVYSNQNLFALFSSFLMVIIDFVVESVVQHGEIFRTLDSTEFFSPQKLAWIYYCCFLGGLASPVFLFDFNTLNLAVHLTFLILFVLISISFISPSRQFIPWAKKLKICEFGLLVCSVGSSVFPITTVMGAIFFFVSVYGGIVLYQLFFLCHSQEAYMEAYMDDQTTFCPPALCVQLLLDIIN